MATLRIGTALAADPTLRRQDLFGIAVLSLRRGDINPAAAADAGTVPPTPRNVSFADLNAVLGGGGGIEGSGGGGGEGNDPVCKPLGMPLKPIVDMNPLKPCGACKEWLYKITEVNPGFKVLMFSDVHCDEVYIKTVAQC